MEEKSRVEAVAGNTLVNVAANAATLIPQLFPSVGAQLGATAVPLLSAVPFLLQTLAAGRQSARIESCLKTLSDDVAQLKCDITNITDDQYKLASECSLAFLSTVHQAKLDLLRQAIVNTLVDAAVADGSSEALGRLVRDISAPEALLTTELFKYRGIVILDKPSEEVPANYHAVDAGTNDAIMIGGLIRLGLLYSLSTSWAFTTYEWSPLTAKFIALVRRPTST